MVSTRQPKKSESIEIRLSHEAKMVFMERCREDRKTASDAIRGFIDGQIERRAPNHPIAKSSWHTVVAIVAGAALGMGAAAPSLAHAAQTSRGAFNQLDRNHDGTISYEEFRNR